VGLATVKPPAMIVSSAPPPSRSTVPQPVRLGPVRGFAPAAVPAIQVVSPPPLQARAHQQVGFFGPHHTGRVPFAHSLRDRHRIADASLAGYTIYIGTDASPDLTGDPTEAAASLPHETSTTLAASHTYHVVVRARNVYGLESLNENEVTFEIDADGDQVLPRPSAPRSVTAEAAADGAIRIRAHYNGLPDTTKATTWLIYQTDDGSDPVVGVDEPTEVAMTVMGGQAILDRTAGEHGDGTTVKTMIATRYTADEVDIDSTTSAIVSATSNTDAPDAPSAGIYFGSLARQGQ